MLRPAAPIRPPVTMFVHLPKTAGTTFNSILSYQYGHRHSLWVPWDEVVLEKTLLSLPAARRDKLNLIRGHFPFGWHTAVSRPVRYITMLRHPVDRVLSMYYYFQDGPVCHEQRLARSSRSVEHFVASQATPQVDNDQVRRLAGGSIGLGEVTGTTLQTAMDNLSLHFHCVGLTERFDESILLMARALQWRKPLFYVSGNVTKRRPTLDSISTGTRATIERYNEHDLALYEFAVKRFERALQDVPGGLQEARQRLRRRNRWANLLLPAPLWVLRRCRTIRTTIGPRPAQADGAEVDDVRPSSCAVPCESVSKHQA